MHADGRDDPCTDHRRSRSRLAVKDVSYRLRRVAILLGVASGLVTATAVVAASESTAAASSARRDSAPPISAPADCRPHSDTEPAWSPRGDVIVFARAGSGRGGIYSIRSDGTGLRRLWAPPAGVARAPEWSPDGSLIAVAVLSGERRQLWLVGADGSNPRLLVDDPYEPRVGFRDLSFSPSGERLAFVGRSAGSSQLEIVDLNGKRTRLTSEVEVFNPRWSPDGRLLAYRAYPKIRVIEPTGSGARDVTEPFQLHYGWLQSWSPDGKRLVHEGGGEPSPKVAITSIGGGTRYGNFGSDPVWAPRGQLIAYVQLVRLNEGRSQLFVLDARTMSSRRLTADVGGREGADNYQPAWSPGATGIAFASSPRRQSTPDGGIALGPGEIRLVDVDGTNERRLTHQCVLGTGRSNRLTGTRLNDVIIARGGNDRIDGRAGPDLILAGVGSDRIAAKDGTRDRIVCGPGRDVAQVDRRDLVARDCESVSRG
jgi:Tol biopolymer transport system component